MRRLRPTKKCYSTAVFLRHFFGAPFSEAKWKRAVFALIFSFALLNSGGWTLLGQEPYYVHDPAESKNLDQFSITAADAINPQAKINRLIIAVDVAPNGEKYVLTFGNGIKKVGVNGGLVDFIPNTSNRLSNALDFAINSEGKFFVATNESNRRFIRVYSPQGVYLSNETLGDGSYGTGADKFKGPSGLTFDNDDNLYVADHYLGNADPPPSRPSSIKIYRKDATGSYKNNLVKEFDNVNGTVLNFPYRLAVNSTGQLYMSELGQDNNAKVRIINFDSNFNPTGIVNGPSANLGAPGSIIIDKFDYVFVADFGNEIDLPRLLAATGDLNEFYAVFEIIKNGIRNNVFNINVYNPDNTFHSKISNQIDFPIDLAISPCGSLYVDNAIFDGDISRICIPFFGCTNVPDFDLDFDLEAYDRSEGYDTEAPVLVTCTGDIEEELTNGTFFLKDYSNLAQFSDNCDSELTIVQSPAVNTPITESTVVTLTAVDDSGNESEKCSFQIIIQNTPDTTDPVFSNCPPPNTNFENDAGECGAIVNYTIPTATDNSGSVTVTLTTGPSPGAFFPVGNTQVTYTATDGAGNSAECTFIITVIDEEDPTITCPENIVETVAIGETGKVINYTLPTFGDNCPGAVILQTAGQASGTVFPVGQTITNTFKVTDATGKFATCSFTVTVEEAADEEDPVITCPGQIVSLTDPGQCGATVTYETPEATDNSGSANVTKISGPDSGDFLAPGGYEVIFEARDAANNTATCTLEIVVQDEEAPVFTSCIDEIQFLEAENGKYIVPNYILEVLAVDNCNDIITYTQSIEAGTEITNDTFIHIFAYDESNNESVSCSFEVVLVEEEQPSFKCGIPPGNLDLDENCDYPARDFSYLITTRENFTNGIFIEQNQERIDNILHVELLVYHGVDENGQLVGECNFEIILEDNQDPVIENCDSSPVNLGFSAGQNFTVPNYSSRITYKDNCGTPQVIQIPAPGSIISQNTTVSLRVEDDAGNSSNVCSFPITFAEDSNSISCRTAQLQLGETGTVSLDPALIFDGNSSDPAIEKLEVEPNNFLCEDLGLQQVELTVTFKNGTSASCSTQIEILDVTPAQFDCPGEIAVSFDPQEGYVLPDYSKEFNVQDNCGFEVTQIPSPGTVLYGSQQIDLIIEDAGENIVNCYFVLRLNSIEEFRITSCPSSEIIEASENCQGVLPDYTTEIETSEPYVNIIQLPSPGSMISETTEVSITVTGPTGLTDTCTFAVEVKDTTPPNIVCPEDITVLPPSGELFVLPDYTELAQVSDNCTYTVIQSPAPGVQITGEETEISFSVTDEAGLSATCSFTLFISEDAPLEITCPGDQSESFEENCSFTMPDYTAMASVTWPTAQVSQDPPMGAVVSGPTQVTLTAVDGNETDSCTFMLELVDDTPPTISCRETFELFLNEEGYGILTAEILLIDAKDNCGIQSSVLSQTRFETSDVGENDVIVTVTDVNGQVSTCTTTVTVTPFEQSGGVSCIESITLPLDEEGKRELNLTYSGDEENIELELSKNYFTCDDIGSQMITATYYGEHTGSCEIEIIVIDDLPPVVNCVSEIDLILDENGEAEISETDVDLDSSDNCGIESMRLSKSSFTSADIGSQQVRLIVTDFSGNVDFCEVTVNVKPYMATTGELACKDKVTLELNDSGEVILTAQDLYAGDTTGIEFFGEIPYTCEDIGVHTVILSKKDDPSQSCEVEVEVVDSTDPVAVCVSDLEITLSANGTATLSAAEFGSGSTDNCGIASMSLDRASFTTADIGQQQVTLTVVDSSGNTDSCQGVVTIVANEENPPAVECIDLFTLSLNSNGRAELEPGELFSGGTVNGNYTVNQSVFTCEDLGENVVTLSYSTEFEQGSCTVRVVVEDPLSACEIPGPVEGDDLILYPNPGDGLIKFDLSPGLQIDRIEVFDVRGRFIMEHQYDNTVPPLEYTLDLRAYQAGVYPMMIYTNGRDYLKRAIIW